MRIEAFLMLIVRLRPTHLNGGDSSCGGQDTLGHFSLPPQSGDAFPPRGCSRLRRSSRAPRWLMPARTVSYLSSLLEHCHFDAVVRARDPKLSRHRACWSARSSVPRVHLVVANTYFSQKKRLRPETGGSILQIILAKARGDRAVSEKSSSPCW